MTADNLPIPPAAVVLIAGAVVCFAVLDGVIKTLAVKLREHGLELRL